MLEYHTIFNFFCRFRVEDLGSLIKTIDKMNDSENMLVKTLRDLLKFTLIKKCDFALEDLWNSTQWALLGSKSKKRFVVVDAGFSKEVQKTEHYNKHQEITSLANVATTIPEDKLSTFNGKDISDIKDPFGNKIKSKFFTSKASEYILSSTNMARRIKKAGLADDGLHQWKDKLVFVDYPELEKIMEAINSNSSKMMPTRVRSNWKSKLSIQSLSKNGNWKTSYVAKSITMDPVLGKHVLEFNFDGDNIVKAWHPGHDVSYIQVS